MAHGDQWPETRLLVNGELRPAAGGRTYDNINPATATVAGVAADGSVADLDEAVGAARAAFDSGGEAGWGQGNPSIHQYINPQSIYASVHQSIINLIVNLQIQTKKSKVIK